MERSSRGHVARGAAAIVALGALGWTCAGVDLARVAALVARSGPWLGIGLAPYALAIALDALAWRTLIAPIARAPLAPLALVRLRVDAFAATLPGGTLVAESMAPSWLRAWMPFDAGVAAVAGRKCVVGAAESAYMLAGVAAGGAALAACAPALPWIVVATAIAMLAVFGGTAIALASGSIAARVHRALARLPVAPLRAWLAAHARGFARADAELVALLRGGPRRLAIAGALSLASWSVESLETWLLLRLVGLDLPFATVLGFESCVSLLRSLGAFMPGGLGVQDLGYVAVLRALGAPHAIDAGAAFLVLKRAKEIAWALAGWSTLLAPRARQLGSAARSSRFAAGTFS